MLDKDGSEIRHCCRQKGWHLKTMPVLDEGGSAAMYAKKRRIFPGTIGTAADKKGGIETTPEKQSVSTPWLYAIGYVGKQGSRVHSIIHLMQSFI